MINGVWQRYELFTEIGGLRASCCGVKVVCREIRLRCAQLEIAGNNDKGGFEARPYVATPCAINH
ncbi:MAG: hypothetical protein LBT94_09465 [Prevotellaceae bacterium]|nr:hypothetical protein [Prevotellaceae bacterium]